MLEQLQGAVWRCHDETGSSSYLVVGDARAAMIDCGASASPLMPAIRKITDLPVELYLTHAHPDHYGAAGEFERIWLHEDEMQALPAFEETFAAFGAAPLPRERLHTFADGQRFDLGGRALLAQALRGHTPGSTIFIDDADRCMFSGDAVGSGDIVLMSLPMTSNVAQYRQELARFIAEHTAGREDYVWHGGHWHQALRPQGESNPPCRALCEDMMQLCDMLLEGKIQGEPTYERFAPGNKALRAYWGRAGIVYTAEQLTGC